MVAGAVDGGRQIPQRRTRTATSSRIDADHRQVQHSDLQAARITAYRGAVPVQDVDLDRSTVLSDGKLQPSACSAAILSVRVPLDKPTMIGMSPTAVGIVVSGR